MIPAENVAAQYWLEDWDLSGRRTMHGPVSPVYSYEPAPEEDQAASESALPSSAGVGAAERRRTVGGEPDAERAKPSSARSVARDLAMAANQNGKGIVRGTIDDSVGFGESAGGENRGAEGRLVSRFLRSVAEGLPAGWIRRKLQLFAEGVDSPWW